MMTRLNREQLEMVAGGSYEAQILELYHAVMKNGNLRRRYWEIAYSDDDLDTEDILQILLAEDCSIKMDIVNDEILYWDGKWTQQEALEVISHIRG
ncbi:MAG: hypothetical protein IJH64_08635 [Oscillospiraceae bacterium]|nr:hypothetical protein [Oscillospiraceae bacterium]